MNRSGLERCDIALAGAFLLNAALGTWTGCLLFNDGAFMLMPGWLGNAWDLYFNQMAERSVTVALGWGPAWFARWAFELSAPAYVAWAHILYFGVLLVLWFAVRQVEPNRIFSRLYLAFALTTDYYPHELIAGVGLWMMWVAVVSRPDLSRRATWIATACFALLLAFSHPIAAVMSVLYLVVGGFLVALGQPFPRRTLAPAAAMSAAVLAAYFIASLLLVPSNPTIAALHKTEKYNYIDLNWMIDTLRVFPMLAALWLLLVLPGVQALGLRRRYLPALVAVVGLSGLWFAAGGTSLLTFLFARHTAPHVLALALALAAVAPATWLAAARRPLLFYAGILAVAGLSYNVDLFLFGRFVDRHLAAGYVDADTLDPAVWPRQQVRSWPSLRTVFKWAAGADYVRDVVMPDYQQYQHALAYYTFFRSNRRGVIFHRIPGGYWLPYECPAVDRAIAGARDDLDRRFLVFLRDDYCVR
jgi:hypothetical protein